MESCNHTFAYWSVIPPSHCPRCGACLTCGSPRHPIMPHPSPWPYPLTPWWQTGPTCTTTTTNVTSDTSGISAVVS